MQNNNLLSEKQKLEIEKLKIEINSLKNKWINPNMLINYLILISGLISVIFLTRITDIKNERLELDQAQLKRNINIFQDRKDSIKSIIDSLEFLSVNIIDSMLTLHHENEMLRISLIEKQKLIAELNNKSVPDRYKNLDSIQNTISTILASEPNRNLIKNDFIFYPNPSKGKITFALDTSFVEDNYKLEIINLKGRVVFKQIITNSKEFTIDLDLDKGIYFVVLKNLVNNEKKSKKLIIN